MNHSDTYRRAFDSDINFYLNHGYLVVKGAICGGDLSLLSKKCDEIIAHKEQYAIDLGWRKDQSLADREFSLLQANPTIIWPELLQAAYHSWVLSFARQLMGTNVEFWYGHLIAKAPHVGLPTPWHQDEAYWGRCMADRGITCWIPLHSVDRENGCMQFIAGGHRDGILDHKQVSGMKTNILECQPDETRGRIAPLEFGDVTFHHGKTPHMAFENKGSTWRRALTIHIKAEGTDVEFKNRDHYGWKVIVTPNNWQSSRSGIGQIDDLKPNFPKLEHKATLLQQT